MVHVHTPETLATLVLNYVTMRTMRCLERQGKATQHNRKAKQHNMYVHDPAMKIYLPTSQRTFFR